MLHVLTVLKDWRCPKLGRDVGLRINTLRDLATGEIRTRKFECNMASQCNLPAKEGSLSQYDYATCVSPDAVGAPSGGDAHA